MLYVIKKEYMLWRMHRCYHKRDKAFEKGDYAKSAYYQDLIGYWMDKILGLLEE